MEKVELKLDGVTNELTIREGEAAKPLPLKEPQIINISGDIHSVANFIRDRKTGHSSQAIDTNKAIVMVNKDGKTITMDLDPENHYGTTVKATLETAKELKQFGINTTTRYGRKQLLDLLRFNRLFFEDKNEHAKIIEGLYKLRIKSQTEIEQESSNQGNKKSLVEVKVIDDGGFTRFFKMTLPLYKGFPAQNIEVEVCYDLLNGDISFWLESIGLKETMEAQIDDIFATELKSCEGFVIIHQ